MSKDPSSQNKLPAVHSYMHVARRGGIHPYFKISSKAKPQLTPWNITTLCQAYSWPSNLSGRGVIAIVELGGGWLQSDVNGFFSGLGLPAPHITDVSVDGTTNTKCSPSSGDDGEVALDIQVAGAAYAIATGQAATIRIYWAQDITAALQAATKDGCDICSISWGADEATWGQQAALALEQAAQAATAAGMVVFAAAGDNDSSDGGPTPANVDLPASAPHVIGCGGTKRLQNGTETVWNDNLGKTDGEGTGGGYSTLFPMPSWQAGAPHGPGRLVPDVAANADPVTGYEILLMGQQQVVGGTSAVAPLYAGLFAAFGEKLGFLTPELYLNPMCFNDVVSGNNGAYRAKAGVDPCTGLGSPNGESLYLKVGAPSSSAIRAAKLMSKKVKVLMASRASAPSSCCVVTYDDGRAADCIPGVNDPALCDLIRLHKKGAGSSIQDGGCSSA